MQRKLSRTSELRLTRAMLLGGLILVSIVLTSCQTTASAVTSPAMCTVFKPIYWSKDDTLDTAKQVREHNAVWKSVCGQTN